MNPVKTAKGAINGVKTAVKNCGNDKATCAGKITFGIVSTVATAGAANGANAARGVAQLGVKGVAKAGVSVATNAAKTAAQLGVKGMAKAGANAVKNTVANIAKLGVKGVAQKGVAVAKTATNAAVKTAKNYVKQTADNVMGELNMVKKVATNIKNGITTGLAKGKAAVGEAFNRVKNAGKALTDKTFVRNGKVVPNTLTTQQRLIKAKQTLTGQHKAGTTMVCTL